MLKLIAAVHQLVHHHAYQFGLTHMLNSRGYPTSAMVRVRTCC